jgi:hypothetical protein
LGDFLIEMKSSVAKVHRTSQLTWTNRGADFRLVEQ